MKIKTILLEMTADLALKALDISQSDARDASKLKAAYKAASLKNHPDRGGSADKMKDVNLAYEFLSKYTGSSTGGNTFDAKSYDDSRKEYLDLGKAVLEVLKGEFRIQNFINHFSKIYSTTFQYNIAREWPKATDRSTSHAGMDVEFFNDTRDIVFKINFSVYLIDVKYNKSIGGGTGNISYPLGVSAYGFFNNKKLKITQRDYLRTSDHDVLSNPELAFPTKRLEKFKTTASSKQFRKEDMILTLKNKIADGAWYNDAYAVKLTDGRPRLTIQFNRHTFNRLPYWDINYFVDGKYQQIERVGVMYETIETANFFIELANGAKNKTPEQVVSYLNSRISKYKSEKPAN